MLPRTTDAAAPLPRGTRPPRPFRSLPWSILLTAAVIAAASGLYLRGQLVVAGQVAATALSLLVAVAAGLALAARRGASELRAREAALERAQLEAQLSRAERMASLGTLAAGMAHELNSPLASVLANARFAAGELRARPGADLHEVTEALDDAVEATERAAAVVRSLDVFATAGADATRIAELRREVSAATRAVNEPRRPQLVKARRSA
ncbi:MAG TPA: histidine kinase dimerization/phospho-acceptor domain-containing protein [Anaeromyxobacteraceae bacterium]|nr:histidine kinase dimerization/phospho-acceptor domain-containing protein [Anaeromyxobacteraceae bacterium]